jgi:hypothetical protein
LRQKSLLLCRQMDNGMSTQTKNEVMSKLRRRYPVGRMQAQTKAY